MEFPPLYPIMKKKLLQHGFTVRLSGSRNRIAHPFLVRFVLHFALLCFGGSSLVDCSS